MESLRYLFDLIHWHFSKDRKMIGKTIYFMGRNRRIVGETYRFFWLQGFPKGFDKNLFFSDKNGNW